MASLKETIRNGLVAAVVLVMAAALGVAFVRGGTGRRGSSAALQRAAPKAAPAATTPMTAPPVAPRSTTTAVAAPPAASATSPSTASSSSPAADTSGLAAAGVGQVPVGGDAARTGAASKLVPGLFLLGLGSLGLRTATRRRA